MWPCVAIQESFNAFHIKTFESFLELSLGVYYEIITPRKARGLVLNI